MSETKFTKGPWIVNSNGSYFNIGPKNDCSSVPVYPDACMGVMHCDEANANLIAAAPEMYEILERLVDPSNCKKDIIHIIGNAESLLAKARGEK